jgi:hypothetical protein
MVNFFLGLSVDVTHFCSRLALFYLGTKGMYKTIVFAFRACGWGLPSTFQEFLGGKGMFLCFYVF